MHAETKAILETNLAAVMQRIADAQREAEELQPVANELRAMLNGGYVMEVKVDGIECMRKALAPGAILLSAEAQAKLYEKLDKVRSPGVLSALLAECGGIASTKGACDL